MRCAYGRGMYAESEEIPFFGPTGAEEGASGARGREQNAAMRKGGEPTGDCLTSRPRALGNARKKKEEKNKKNSGEPMQPVGGACRAGAQLVVARCEENPSKAGLELAQRLLHARGREDASERSAHGHGSRERLEDRWPRHRAPPAGCELRCQTGQRQRACSRSHIYSCERMDWAKVK